jgi:hypothetical protein
MTGDQFISSAHFGRFLGRWQEVYPQILRIANKFLEIPYSPEVFPFVGRLVCAELSPADDGILPAAVRGFPSFPLDRTGKFSDSPLRGRSSSPRAESGPLALSARPTASAVAPPFLRGAGLRHPRTLLLFPEFFISFHFSERLFVSQRFTLFHLTHFFTSPCLANFLA